MFKRLLGRERASEEEQRALADSLSRSGGGLRGALGALLGAADITDETWDDLEAILIQADVGAATAVEMVDELREQARHAGVRRAAELPRLLRHVMIRRLERMGDEPAEAPTDRGDRRPAAGAPATEPSLTVMPAGAGRASRALYTDQLRRSSSTEAGWWWLLSASRSTPTPRTCPAASFIAKFIR